MKEQMNAEQKTVTALLSTIGQYQIPLYQRRYEWTKSSWEMLWNDILKQANAPDNAKHFTGPIVTRLIKPHKNRYEVIDGQQRLMTFQIIFCTIRDLCELFGFCKLNSNAKYHLENHPADIGDLKTRDPDNLLPHPKYKFVSSRYDDSTFKKILEEYGKKIHKAYNTESKHLINKIVSEITSDVFGNNKFSHNILDVYVYFYEVIRKHVETNDDKITEKNISNLLDIIMRRFELVQITPGQTQRGEEIFASVNATGRKLSEFGYLRNNLFLHASEKSGEFYDNYWIFDNDSNNDSDFDWRDDRLDRFFQAFLMAKLGPDILNNGAKLFDLYQEMVGSERDLEKEFKELKEYAETYEKIEDSDEDLGKRMQVYKDLSTFGNRDNSNSGVEFQHTPDTIRMQSLILYLKHDVKEISSNEEIDGVLDVLESYTVRRLLIDTAAGTYAQEQIEYIFKELYSKKFTLNIESLIKILKTGGKNQRKKWIPYNEIQNQFRISGDRERKIQYSYFQHSLRFAERYIFYRIENHLRKMEGQDPLPFEDFPLVRVRMLGWKKLFKKKYESLGNATFCDHGHNPWDSFNREKEFIKKNDSSNLMLNQEICSKDEWNEGKITDREEKLIDLFIEIWPEEESFNSFIRKSESHPPKVAKKPKVESQWISMIQSNFADQPIMFIAYPEAKGLSQIKVTKDKVEGTDENTENQTIEKSNIFAVCSKNAWAELLYKIIKKPGLQAEKQQPILDPTKQLQIDNRILQAAQNKGFCVTVLTRSGHQFSGRISRFENETIHLQIEEHQVIVFRLGLLEFATGIPYEGFVKDWGQDDLFGSIECESPDISQEIKVKFEFIDQSILSQNLLPNMKVTFNLNIVQENGKSHFQARDVKPITTSELHQGRIKWFQQREGKGFITTNNNPEEKIYLNKSQVPRKERHLLRENKLVEFNIAETTEGHSSVAINVKVVQ